MGLFDLLNEMTGNEITVEPLKVLTAPAVTLKQKAKRTKKKVEKAEAEVVVATFESILHSEESNVADVRTDRQKGRKVSYDVGEVIGGSRKYIRSLKERFLESPSAELIEEIENDDLAAAIELATKENVFGELFTMQAMVQRDMEVNAAYAITLLIRRIPSNSIGLKRLEYMKGMLYVAEQLKVVKTFKELSDTLYRLRPFMYKDYNVELSESSLIYLQGRINGKLSLLTREKVQKQLEETLGLLFTLDMRDQFAIDQLGKFAETISEHKGISKFMKNNLNKFASWDEYFEKKSSKKEGQGSTSRKPVWERMLPKEILRIGGAEVPTMSKPEDYSEFFNFRAIECGHWMKDEDALSHLTNSAKSFVDLADLLNIDIKQISLGSDLAIAFGARGRSKASGHYERGYNVINFTKEKGSLGIAAHEWFHAYDRFLKKKLAVTDELELMTEGKNVYEYPIEVQNALLELFASFKEGKSIAEFSININNSYRISAVSRELFADCEGDVLYFVDKMMEDFDERIERALQGYSSDSHREKAKVKYDPKRKKYLRTTCEVAAILHLERTGEQLYYVPYTVPVSRFYSNALQLDRGTPKYWATNVELAARAFEAYVNLKLKQEQRVSHYLVCGLDMVAYPYGSELKRISKAMENFLEVTLPYLRSEQ